jgi:DNA-3-methyladenine glycosylase
MANSSTSSSARAWAANAHPTLPRSFYARDTLRVARELLGKILVTRARGAVTAGRIVETEAYHGTDPAAHCGRGQTPRSAIMFGDAGVAYVYFIYGNYEMLNFVTERRGYPGAVLIRALEPVHGLERMRRRRPLAKSERDLTNGPGRLCQAMGVRLRDNGASLQGPRIAVVDDGFRPEAVMASPRVGISRATAAEWRYFIAGNPWVSRAPQNRAGRPAGRSELRSRRRIK